MPRCAAAPISIFALIALPAAADSSAAIAAPRDCAQPIGEFATPLVYGQSAGVSGPPSESFAPRAMWSAVDGTTDGVAATVEGAGAAIGVSTNAVSAGGNQVIAISNGVATGIVSGLPSIGPETNGSGPISLGDQSAAGPLGGAPLNTVPETVNNPTSNLGIGGH
ncbi:MAG TPA: hypothetical protein VKH41_09460 [Myxococcota bacterium]|nr:hypothetical protein [Myxococcota bacterium]